MRGLLAHSQSPELSVLVCGDRREAGSAGAIVLVGADRHGAQRLSSAQWHTVNPESGKHQVVRQAVQFRDDLSICPASQLTE
jgi:hypothetical protein